MRRRFPWWVLTGLVALSIGPVWYALLSAPHPRAGERVFVADPEPDGASTGFQTFRALDGGEPVVQAGRTTFHRDTGPNGLTPQFLNERDVRQDGRYLYITSPAPPL